MNHGWDDSTWQDRAARGERERFGTSRIVRDPDVERRDRLREQERRRAINQSPWSIGLAYYDQTDLYTRNSSIVEEGYGRGPHQHPKEGSYAYRRDFRPGIESVPAPEAGLYEREAWPWLNYRGPDDDPYFSHLREQRDPSLWERVKTTAIELKDRAFGALHLGGDLGRDRGRGGTRRKVTYRSDGRIKEDVSDALAVRGDLDASDIEVTVRGGEVTLEGTVTDRREKRVAEEVCESIAGVRDVHNRLSIRRDDPSDGSFAFVLPLALSPR